MKRYLMFMALAGALGAATPEDYDRLGQALEENVSTEIRDIDALRTIVDLARSSDLGLSKGDRAKLIAIGSAEEKQQLKQYDEVMKDQCKLRVLDRPVEAIDVAAITSEWAATDRENEARWAAHRNALDNSISPEGQRIIADLIDELKTNGQLAVSNPNFRVIADASPAAFAESLKAACEREQGKAMGVAK